MRWVGGGDPECNTSRLKKKSHFTLFIVFSTTESISHNKNPFDQTKKMQMSKEATNTYTSVGQFGEVKVNPLSVPASSGSA